MYNCLKMTNKNYLKVNQKRKIGNTTFKTMCFSLLCRIFVKKIVFTILF